MAQGARKAIFITGGASGIGRATALRFAREGWLVGLADVNAAGLAETAAMLPAGSAHTVTMDVRDRAQWDAALADFALVTDGRLDVLFNNAGIPAGGPLASESDADLDRIFAINLRGVFHGARAGYPLLRATPGSALVNTSSAAGMYAAPNMAPYAATKYAVRALTEALDQKWASDGIRVRAIMPGFIDTPLLDAHGTASNRTLREVVRDAKLEFTPVEHVADAVWAAAHTPIGGKVFWPVGKTANRLAFWSRWAPAVLAKQGRKLKDAV